MFRALFDLQSDLIKIYRDSVFVSETWNDNQFRAVLFRVKSAILFASLEAVDALPGLFISVARPY